MIGSSRARRAASSSSSSRYRMSWRPPGGATAPPQRALPAPPGEARRGPPEGSVWIGRPGWAGHRARRQSIAKSRLASRPSTRPGDRRQHLEPRSASSARTDRPYAVSPNTRRGRRARAARRSAAACAPSWALAGATATAVIRGWSCRWPRPRACSRQSAAAALAAVTHLRVDGRDDPIGAGAAKKPRHAVLVEVEVLADQLPQQPLGLGHPLVGLQFLGLLHRPQRPFGVGGHPAQHPLPRGPLAPAAIRLLRGPGVVELQAVPAAPPASRRRPRPRRAASARRDAPAGRCPGWPPRRASAWSPRSARPARPSCPSSSPAAACSPTPTAACRAATAGPGT